MKKIRIIPFIAIVVAAAAVVFAILSVFVRRSLGVSMGSFYLAVEACPPAWHRFHVTETWDINRREHPDGAAFHLHADPRTLRQLAEFAGSVTESIGLCDHIAAYSPETSPAHLPRSVLGTAVRFHSYSTPERRGVRAGP
jgi:hypothetical protein